MNRMPRFVIALAVAATAAVVPSAASAADYYVQGARGDTACTQDDPCRLSHAIALATAASDHDTIHVSGPVDYNGSADFVTPVTLIGSGSGPGGTALELGSGYLRVGPSSSVSGVSIHSMATAVVLDTGGSISDSAITAAYGIEQFDDHSQPSNIDNVDIVAGTQGITVAGYNTTALTTITDSSISAPTGITETDGGQGGFHLVRSVIRSSTLAAEVWSSHETTIDDSLIELSGSGRGIYSRVGAAVTVNGSTVYSTSGHGYSGIEADGSPSAVAVRGSIVRGFTADVMGEDAGSGHTGTARVSDSDFVTTNGNVVDEGGNLSADPRWVDPANGDFHLKLDSPLIDRAGTAVAAGETDLAGLPRANDGDDDDAAARDMGAYEYQWARPVAKLSADATTVEPRTTVLFDAGGSNYSAGSIVSYAWDLDGDGTYETNTAGSPKVSHLYTDVGTTTVRVKVAASDGTTGVASVGLTVKAPQQPADEPAQEPQAASPAPQTPAAPPTQQPAAFHQPVAPLTVAFGTSKLALNRRGQGTLSVTCSATPCTVKLVLATAGKRPHTLGRANGKGGKLTVRLSRAALPYVKQHRVRSVVVTASAASGVNSAHAARTVSLKTI